MAREKKEPVADGARSSVTQYVFQMHLSRRTKVRKMRLRLCEYLARRIFTYFHAHVRAHSRLVHCFRLIIDVGRKERESIFFSPFDFKEEEHLRSFADDNARSFPRK